VTDQELIAVLDARFGSLETRFSRVETDVRHANVQIEGLRDETRQVAESVILVDEKLERFRVATEERFDEVDRHFEVIDGRFEEMRRLIARS
jgi:predicted  nucleic acid-binding Zn-ribbon protein